MSEILTKKSIDMFNESEIEALICKAKVFSEKFDTIENDEIKKQLLAITAPSADEKILLLMILKKTPFSNPKMMEFVEKQASKQVKPGVKNKLERKVHKKFIKILQEIVVELSDMLAKSFKLMFENMKALDQLEKQQKKVDGMPDNFEQFIGTDAGSSLGSQFEQREREVREKYGLVKTGQILADAGFESDEEPKREEESRIIVRKQSAVHIGPKTPAKTEGEEEKSQENEEAQQKQY